MATPHIAGDKSRVAKTVLMPGDPRRAQWIAENYLTDARQFTDIRGILGFTGTYKGKPVSVMAHGMGIPSVGIYTWELFTHFEVDNIIRVGSAGAYSDTLEILDVLLVTAAYSESSFARVQNGYDKDTNYPDAGLSEALRRSAAAMGRTLPEGTVHSTDVFYQNQPEGAEPYWKALLRDKGALAVEMETFGLFHNAAATGKKAAALVTISDSFVKPAANLTAEAREKNFGAMIEIALGSL